MSVGEMYQQLCWDGLSNCRKDKISVNHFASPIKNEAFVLANEL